MSIGTWIMLEHAMWIVHTCAWRANEANFVGIIRVDSVAPGCRPVTRWIGIEEALSGHESYKQRLKRLR